MPGTSPRTRLIFQNLNAYVGPAALSGSTATGAMFAIQGTNLPSNTGNNLIAELANIQSASLNVGINRNDINVFGQLARVDQIIISPPTISMDLTWNATDGYNEQMLGFNTNGNSFLSGILTKASDSKNYFLSVSQQGIDDDAVTNPNARDVYAVGNGFVSNYTFNAAVGQVATTSISVDALNVATYTGSSGLQTPAVNPQNSQRISAWNFQLPQGRVQSGSNNVFALRPGDISLSFPSAAGFLVPLSGQNSVQIQSLALSVPISREVLNALGSPFGYSREINFPVNANLQIRALQTEVAPNSFDQLYCNDQNYDLTVTLRQPSCNSTGLAGIILGFNNAKVANIAFSNSIGSDSSVDISMTSQLAGATSLDGITFSGSYTTS